MKATWKGAVIAESDRTIFFDNNHYFPPESLADGCFVDSDTHSTCPWKGVASYKTVVVEGERNPDAAWFYPDPKDAAAEIRGHFAFWRGVDVHD